MVRSTHACCIAFPQHDLREAAHVLLIGAVELQRTKQLAPRRNASSQQTSVSHALLAALRGVVCSFAALSLRSPPCTRCASQRGGDFRQNSCRSAAEPLRAMLKLHRPIQPCTSAVLLYGSSATCLPKSRVPSAPPISGPQVRWRGDALGEEIVRTLVLFSTHAELRQLEHCRHLLTAAQGGERPTDGHLHSSAPEGSGAPLRSAAARR